MKPRNIYIFLILVVATILLRLPYTSNYLYFVDSVIYALGMDKFDLANGTPAAPGCIGYVSLGKLFYHFTRDANRSFVWIAILFSGLGCGMAYLLGKEMYGALNGLIAGVLLLFSPLVWFFGEIAMPVISNLFFSALVAFFCYRAMAGNNKLSPIIFSAVSLGIGAAFRQDLLIFMFPLWLFAISKRPFRQILLGLSILFISSLTWIIPSSISAGGFRAYLLLCRERIFGTDGHISYMTTANIFIKKLHLHNYFFALLKATFLGIVPLIFYLGRFFNPHTIIKDKKIRFLIVWLLPSFIYMNLVGGNYSYIFVHFAAILICLGMALESIYQDFKNCGLALFGKFSLALLTILLIGVNIFFFCYYEPSPERPWTGTSWFKNSDIRKHDCLLETKLGYIKEKFSSEDSIIFAGGQRQTYWPVFYYLPSYKVYQPNAVYWLGESMEMAHLHKQKCIEGPVFKIPEGIKNIIFFDEDIYPCIKSLRPLEEISLEKGYSLYLLRLIDESSIKLALGSLEVF